MCNGHLEALSTTNNLLCGRSSNATIHLSPQFWVSLMALLCWGSQRQDKEASGGLQDKACHGAEAGGLIPPAETHLRHTCRPCVKLQEKENTVSNREKWSMRRIVSLGLLSDRRFHRCGDAELHRRLITRVARGGDDRRSPEQMWQLVSRQTGSLGGMTRQNITKTTQAVAAQPAMDGNLMGKVMRIRLMMHFRKEKCRQEG